MDEYDKRRRIVSVCREMLERELVARTWGNVSCRKDGSRFLITPSGLDYMQTGPDDIADMDMYTGEWKGRFRPSGEYGVHAAGYRISESASFIIHTHQKYASAAGLAGTEVLDITSGEQEMLGGLAAADYGLPGTDAIVSAVSSVFEKGISTVLMAHHGAVITASDADEAMSRAVLLEKICERNVSRKCMESYEYHAGCMRDAQPFRERAGRDYRYSAVFSTVSADICSCIGRPLYAQLDDMAQMIGCVIPVAEDPEHMSFLLRENRAVLLKGAGAAVRADVYDDVQALMLLVDKACTCALYTAASGVDARLDEADAALMKDIYENRYSKQRYRRMD